MLTPTEIETYHRDGLVAPRVCFSAETNLQMRAALDELLAHRADVAPESLICPHIASQRAGGEAIAAKWLSFALNPLVLDCVQRLIGEDIILWGSQVFCKPAYTGRRVPWHQDGKYWPIRPLATVSVWMAIDDATPENGCMRFIPGSHASKSVYTHETNLSAALVLPEQLRASEFDERAAKDDALAAGTFSLHDVFLIHGSEPNRSPHRRAGFVARYMPAASLFDRSVANNVMKSTQGAVRVDYANRPIWLARGRDALGQNDFTIGHNGEYAGGERTDDDTRHE
jgi:ectoine hydroxylase-related dioxygenase (phytanoyl-CoA dioxygenase family)